MNKKTVFVVFFVVIAMIIVVFVVQEKALAPKPAEITKTINEDYCNQYVPDACPDGCIVCPPCPECSSIKCRLSQNCTAAGFDKNWYEQTKPAGGAGMANPASVYCEQQGGKLEIKEGESGQYGICILSDGRQCEEWDFFRTKTCAPAPSGSGNNAACVVENCHGLDIKCGPNAPDVCTEIYELGDRCLPAAKCGIVNGVCQQIASSQFDACKTCVQNCSAQYKNDQIKLFDCESKCPAGSASGTDGKICADCGQGGWQKMDQKCVGAINTKESFKICLMGFSWSSVKQETSVDEIKEGYIEIGSTETLNTQTDKSIKVFIYHQWAVDGEGNLYLLGVLG